MSSVGIIFREPRQLSTLPDDWRPAPLGTRQKVSEVIDVVMQTAALGNLALTMTLEAEEDSASPRTISVSGVWGDKEMAIIRTLCSALDACFYDAEAAEFIEL